MTAKNDFEVQLECLRQSSEYNELPGLEVSMWEEDVAFSDDLSNKERYSDFFVEVDQSDSVRGSFVLYLLFFFHNVSLALFLYYFSDGDLALGILFVPCMAWVFLAVYAFGVRQGGVRFNRQAQMVHVGRGDGAVSVPWRDVKPFMSLSVVGHSLKFYFPIPREEQEEFTDEQLQKIYQGKPFVVDGGMDWRDTGAYGSLRRLEFYRRYMELGLDAVKADADKVGEDAIRPPSQAAQRHRGQGFFLYWVVDPIIYVLCLLAGKPLIDRFLRKQAKKFKWPEEIERLCSPDADLTGINTTPVKPRTDIFYRPRGLDGLEMVDARGQRIG